MQLPRFRFHLRWLLIAIAAIALAFWAQILWQRHETYQRRISINEFYGRQFRHAYETRSKNVFAIQHGPVFAATPELRLRWAEYHEVLRSVVPACREPSLGGASRATGAAGDV